MFRLKNAMNKKRKDFADSAQSGITFLEVIISLLVFSVGALSTLQIINVAMTTHYRATQEVIASNLATGLMAEIMAKKFANTPGETFLGFDTIDGEYNARFSNPPNNWDDVDDYHTFGSVLDNPPLTIGGLNMDGATAGAPNYHSFSRSVNVEWYDASTGQVVGTPTSCKQITVTVSGPGTADYQIMAHKAGP